jgi:formate/nitrite transporter
VESVRIHAILPPQIAKRAEEIGIKKSEMSLEKTFVLAVLAGAFVALGAVFSTTVAVDSTLPYGVNRMMMGLVFCLGLILVVVAGAELFTGNNLIVMAWVSGKVSVYRLLRNWVIVYVGNFVGSVATALLLYATKQYTFSEGSVGLTMFKTASAKLAYEPEQAIALGMMCNALVCLAVWLTYGARSTSDKILAILFPITAFVAAGFEHSVANMYFVPVTLFIKAFDGDFVTRMGIETADLTWGNFLVDNLLPVTIGNIIGGAVMVGVVYWFIYLHQNHR